jgi:hypothetical protein
MLAVGPWGAKLGAVDSSLDILPSHANPHPAVAEDPRIARYKLLPRVGEHSETILLRHGDVITSLRLSTSLRFMLASEVQVTSSAADREIGEPNDATDGVVETPEEDEDIDTTITNVKATQGKSQQPRATPQLSAQRSVVVQETPTAARVNGAKEYSTAHDEGMEMDQSELVETTPAASPGPAKQADAEPYSTARTGQSHDGDLGVDQKLNDEELEPALPCRSSLASPTIDISSNAVDVPSGDTPLEIRHPEVRIPQKRPNPAADEADEADSGAEPVGRSSKRAKRNTLSDYDTPDSRLSTIVVDTSAAKSRKKRVSEVKELEEAAEASPSRSPRSPQRSNTAETADPYEGATPRVATSNSSLAEKSHAVKFLKKQGGSLVESVKEEFNVLW